MLDAWRVESAESDSRLASEIGCGLTVRLAREVQAKLLADAPVAEPGALRTEATEVAVRVEKRAAGLAPRSKAFSCGMGRHEDEVKISKSIRNHLSNTNSRVLHAVACSTLPPC